MELVDTVWGQVGGVGVMDVGVGEAEEGGQNWGGGGPEEG